MEDDSTPIDEFNEFGTLASGSGLGSLGFEEDFPEFKEDGDAGGHDPGVKESKGKKPLAAAARDCAVAPGVVERRWSAFMKQRRGWRAR